MKPNQVKIKNEQNDMFEFEYVIKRSKRKTVSLIIENDGLLRILAPVKYSQKNIDALLDEKKQWITKKIREAKNAQAPQLTFLEGSEVQYLGVSYVLVYHKVNKKKDEFICLTEDAIHLNLIKLEYEMIKVSLVAWYRSQAKMVIHERLEVLQMMTGKSPIKLSVKTQRKRWGSCTSKGHILLNWRLIFAPIEVVDYVIVHELCHLIHMDHSKKFWDKVKAVDQNYLEKRNWLKKNGCIINWPYETS